MSKLIKSYSLYEIHLMDFFTVMQVIINRLDEEDLVALKLDNEVTNFKAVFQQFDDAIRHTSKSSLTEKLIKFDNIRDNLIVGLRYVVKGMTYYSDENLADKAKKIKIIVDKYGVGIADLAQREETGIIINLLQDLQKAEIAPIVTELGLTHWLTQLQNANTTFMEFYADRNEEESQIVVGAAKKQRAITQQAFIHLCKVIEAFAIIEGETPYLPLINRINVEVAKVKEVAKQRKHTPKEEEEEKENNEE